MILVPLGDNTLEVHITQWQYSFHLQSPLLMVRLWMEDRVAAELNHCGENNEYKTWGAGWLLRTTLSV